MGKHINKETKYHYVMKYLNGESPTKLAMEINSDLKSPSMLILSWAKKYYEGGIEALDSKSGKTKGKNQGRKKKKPKPNYDEMSRDELIEHLKIKDIFIDEINKKTRPRYKYPIVAKIRSEFSISIEKICAILFISKSGYYSWLRNPKTKDNFDQLLLKRVNDIYHQQKGNYGAERIMGEILDKYELKHDIKTIRRYMNEIGIQSLIRNPNKRSEKSKEIKDTKDIRKNYVRCDFRDNTSRTKLFTDTSEYKIPKLKIYFSAVIGANKNLYSLNVSTRNNKELVIKDVEEAAKKIGKKFFIQFDNAAFYKGNDMTKLVEKYGGISSFGKPGESKANWPIENFWSILKQEFLRVYKPKTLNEAKQILKYVIFKYNHKRIQKKLNWKTPANARV